MVREQKDRPSEDPRRIAISDAQSRILRGHGGPEDVRIIIDNGFDYCQEGVDIANAAGKPIEWLTERTKYFAGLKDRKEFGVMVYCADEINRLMQNALAMYNKDFDLARVSAVEHCIKPAQQWQRVLSEAQELIGVKQGVQKEIK